MVVAHLEQFGVESILRTIGVSASTFYGWLAQDREPSTRRRHDAGLLAEIREVHERSGQTYGAPRVHAARGVRGARPACVARSRILPALAPVRR